MKVMPVNNIYSFSFKSVKENPKQAAFVSFETVPINKTGGMADVVGELAPELNKKGMDVRVVIPILNAKDGIPFNSKGEQVYKTPKGQEFPIKDLGIDFDYTYGTSKGKGKIFKVEDSRVKFPVYALYCPDDVSRNSKEYEGWIMDQVKNQEGFCKAALEALKKLNNDTEEFNPKYIMSYEWTTAPIIEGMAQDRYFDVKKKVGNINNFGAVYQGRTGAPVAAPYLLSDEELELHCAEPATRALLEEINNAVKARAGMLFPYGIDEEIQSGRYKDAYLKIARNYEKYIPYTTNHLGFMDELLMNSFPNKGWFDGYYNFYIPAVRKADSLVSCSDTYMRELAEENLYSEGLANIMNLERLKSFGITIGMDYNLYNPAFTEKETTKPVKYPFSIEESERTSKPELLDYKTGKEKNKTYLQSILKPAESGYMNPLVGAKQYGYLDNNKDAMVSTFITRFDPAQKGVDIAIKAAKMLLEEEKYAQIILAGPDFKENNALIKEYLDDVVNKYPGRAVLCDGFINNIAQFYAGSDTVLIPSRFAPFELVQLQGMRLGAIPIASNSGGLAEIIVDEKDGDDNSALGFKTKESLLLSKDPDRDFCNTVKRAVNVYKNNPAKWDSMLQNCLRYKRSWDKPAQAYIDTIFNPLNYNNIEDIYYVDERFSAGAISVKEDKRKEDLEFLKHKGFTQIIQIDEADEDLRKMADSMGLKYKVIDLGDTPNEESTVKLLKEIDNSEEKSFINEIRGKNNKSVLASLYLAYKSKDSINDIMRKIWTEREKDFDDVIWGNRDKIRDLMKKLSYWGKKHNHDISKLNLGNLFVKVFSLENAEERMKSILQKFTDLRILKEKVYSGRHYLK